MRVKEILNNYELCIADIEGPDQHQPYVSLMDMR